MKNITQLKIAILITIISVYIKFLPILAWSDLPFRESQLYNLFIIVTVFYLIILSGIEIVAFKKSSNEESIESLSINLGIVPQTILYLFVPPIAIWFCLMLFTSTDSGFGTIIKYYYSLTAFIVVLYFIKYTKVFIARFITILTNILTALSVLLVILLLLLGLYHLIISAIANYYEDTVFYNTYVLALLIPGILLISQKTRKYFIFAYIIAIVSSYYFHIYKYSHDYEVIFKKQGISCYRSDNPEYGCLFEYVKVHEGDEIETLDGKKEISTQNINSFCVNEDNERPYTYYFLLNNTIYKYIHKKDAQYSK